MLLNLSDFDLNTSLNLLNPSKIQGNNTNDKSIAKL